MQKHVISREEAEKLKPNLPEGFESKYNWWVKEGVQPKLYPENVVPSRVPSARRIKWESYPAPLLTELLDLLPDTIGNKKLVIDMDWGSIGYEGLEDAGCGCCSEEAYLGVQGFKPENDITAHDNILDAASQLYRWLVDNKYVKGDFTNEKTNDI